MAVTIIHDQDLGIAVLVDTSGPHALGPAIAGDGADAILEAFVQGLDQDPAEFTAFELAVFWAQFLVTFAGTPDSPPETSQVDAGGEPAPEPSPGEPAPEPAPEEAAEGTAALEAGRDEPPPAAPADQDWPPCPNCTSTKREISPDGTVTCAVCGEELEAR